jgi:hypothetical protein
VGNIPKNRDRDDLFEEFTKHARKLTIALKNQQAERKLLFCLLIYIHIYKYIFFLYFLFFYFSFVSLIRKYKNIKHKRVSVRMNEIMCTKRFKCESLRE